MIGYVGTSGETTEPELHFELIVDGKPVDPLRAAETAVSDGSAAEVLTDRIIRVESGGNATAKNPLSSAAGLGQFIDSTWLRMMRTYRPDLARSLSRADQLALRFDPTISREMVLNLAHEGEAYLRARGIAITAGRLYLCHFLGMEGAAAILTASPDASIAGRHGTIRHLGQSIPHREEYRLRDRLGGAQDDRAWRPRPHLDADADRARLAGIRSIQAGHDRRWSIRCHSRGLRRRRACTARVKPPRSRICRP